MKDFQKGNYFSYNLLDIQSEMEEVFKMKCSITV